MSRRPVVTINGEALRAIFTKPKMSDTRPFVVRLLESIRLVVKGNFKTGLKFLGIRGGADF